MGALDSLRSAYVRAPNWVQSTAGRLLALVPPGMTYGSSFRHTRTAIDRSRWDSAFVEEQTAACLRSLLQCAKTTPFYARSLTAVDAASATPADLGALPVVTRGIVRDNVDDMLAMPKQRLDEAMTSGSSDAALTVYLDKDRSVREWAFVTHAWRAAGFRLGDRRAVMRGHLLRGAQSRYWSWEPGTRELRLSPLRLVPSIMDEYLDLIARFRVAFLHGYPSAITLLAAHARRVGWQPPTTLRGVLPISESLLPHQRAIIRDGFGPLPVVPFYGLTEKVAFACEVPDEPDVYEFEPLYGITEILGRDGRWVGTGQRGRLVGTGFLSTGMPLVRYFTGDLATVVRHPSAENCWRLRVTDLVSAKRQFYLVTAEGGLAPRTGLTHNDVARDYQFVQWEPGRAILRLVPEPGVTQRDLDVFVETVRVDSDGLLTYETEIVNEIPATSRGKRVFIEQHLDLAKYGLPDG